MQARSIYAMQGAFFLWSLTLATKPGLTEELKTKSLKLNTPNLEEFQFDSIVELAR
jgi:hypothetical protein